MSSGLLKETTSARVCSFPTVSVYCCLTATRRTDEKKQKSVRGCLVGLDNAMLSLAIVKQGETGVCTFIFVFYFYLREFRNTWQRLDPKQATRCSKLSKEDDVRKHVVHREVKSGEENTKPYKQTSKIRCFLTPMCLLHSRHLHSVTRRKLEHQKEQKS
ncbi:hypothetical protein ARMGADRAFT_1144503 [Armillaria gallica]|uniref:Uncharacterized protein n=1 Tax=Armillaria gallica TaxID=47427 RepID=A0A2H3CIU1_ARMGA|nr:hypothetical protein ARMGADRAFT_1144503 [Armillaria gallica]